MSYAIAALATFDNMLGTLDHLVSKAMAAGVSDDLLQAKLAEDMFPLESQFRIAINQTGTALARLTGAEIPTDDDAYTSIAEVRERLKAMRERVAQAKSADWPAADQMVEFTLPNGMAFAMQAHEYLRDWTMPNFYFHTSMVYGLLRANGLEIGKADLIPHMMRYFKAPTA
jgi:hypothetical protein